MTLTTDQDNAVLDRIIGKRRSHRKFTQEIPPDEMVEGIIHAGLHAPFAAAAIGNEKDYFRRFVVVRKGSKAMKELVPLVFDGVVAMAGDLERAAAGNAGLREQAAGFMNRLAAIKSMGMVPGIGIAPFYIIAAEKKGFPPVEQLSLAHCMENMWLKATALCLGFQIVSVTAQMADNSEFCRIIGLEVGKWALMGLPSDTRPIRCPRQSGHRSGKSPRGRRETGRTRGECQGRSRRVCPVISQPLRSLTIKEHYATDHEAEFFANP